MHQRILILNWRDIRNPSSGGAEVLTHEMAKRWVLSGHRVDIFSSYFHNSKKTEEIEGVKVFRDGNPDARHLFNSVHFKALLFYIKNRKNYDVVIDEIHGLPFFTPLYVGKKKVALICEVAGEIWDKNFSFPFNIIGKLIERNYFALYRDIKFLTISESTKADLIKYGVKPQNIIVLPMGINIPENIALFPKEKSPTLIFVGRLMKAKGIEDAIEVCRLVKGKIPSIKLWIVGRGDKKYEQELKARVDEYGLKKNIKFLGFVDQKSKFEMLSRANLLIAPSIKEGFGLTIPEAGIVRTPSVAYNVNGLRDLIINRETGILVKLNTKEMSKGVIELLEDNSLYKKVQSGVFQFSKKFNWNNTAKSALEAVSN